MRKTVAKTPEPDASRADFWSWVGVLLPASAWACQLQALYLTSDYGCEHYEFGYSHLVSAVALVLSIVSGFIAWRGFAAASAEEDEYRSMRSRRFLNLVGIGMSALFTALIFAQWLPTLTGVPCGK
jgi:uncharacterized membrane protein YbhN (UPF0104 family)